jgi:tetratricopeptide (TPR) repeat protein
MRWIVLALVLVGGVAAAQQQPPQGDPGQDTQAADAFLKRGRYEDAIRQAKLALGRDEKYVPAMIVLAKAYYFEKKFELATAILDIAKSIDANNAEAFNLLGFIALNRDPSNPDRISATAAFKKATELKDDYTAAWNNLAAQYLYSKNYDGAVNAAEKAAQLAPKFAKAQLNLGSAYRGKERYADAEKAYKAALDIDSGYADAYFDLGILYLDAKEMPGTDLITKLNTAINYLNKYKQTAGSRLVAGDPADTYIAEARTGIDRETKRLQRLERQKAREKPKTDAAAPAPSDGKVKGDK